MKKQNDNKIPMALLQLYQGGDVIIADNKVVRILPSTDLSVYAASYKDWFLEPVVILIDPEASPSRICSTLANVSQFIAQNTDQEEDDWMHAYNYWQ